MERISLTSKNCRKRGREKKSRQKEIKLILQRCNSDIRTLINHAEKRAATDHPKQVMQMGTEEPSNFEILSNKTNLISWALQHNIPRRSVNDLLRILKDIGLNWLCLDSRTLLKTPRFTNINDIAGGQFWYNGIETNLRLNFSNIQSNVTAQLNINVDGVPLMKSSATQFWPIMANVHSMFIAFEEFQYVLCTHNNLY